MKKLMIVLIVLSIVACKKNEKTSSSTSSNSTPNSVSSQQTMLQGNWVLRRELFYQMQGSFDSLLSYTNYYSPTTCYLNLTNTASTSQPGYFTGTGSIICSPSASVTWQIPTLNNIYINGIIYPISYLSNDSLVFYFTSSNVKVCKVYNKTGNPPTMSATEKAINLRTWTAYLKDNFNTAGTIIISSSAITTNTFNPTYNICDFKSTWSLSNKGYDCTAQCLNSTPTIWEVVNGRINFSSNGYYNIDTLNATAFTITLINTTGMPFIRYHMR